MMLACVTAVVLISCSGAASAVTTPRLRENDLRGIATRHSNEFEPERVAGYFRLNRTHAGEPCRCGDSHHYAQSLIWYPAAHLPFHPAQTRAHAGAFHIYTELKPCPAPQPRCSISTSRCADSRLTSGKLRGSSMPCLTICSISCPALCPAVPPEQRWRSAAHLAARYGEYTACRSAVCRPHAAWVDPFRQCQHALMPAGGPGGSSALAVFEGAARYGHTLVTNPRAVKHPGRGQTSTAQASALHAL